MLRIPLEHLRSGGHLPTTLPWVVNIDQKTHGELFSFPPGFRGFLEFLGGALRPNEPANAPDATGGSSSSTAAEDVDPQGQESSVSQACVVMSNRARARDSQLLMNRFDVSGFRTNPCVSGLKQHPNSVKPQAKDTSYHYHKLAELH